ncbi:MAG: hypothetical protein A2073_00440 [Deltaproteobacteria bacterium GWC2_42_11]|nr:MAG: hypothetical protein A2073_00440 [Deltaproteobacteria bacterium GWC2_42_11]
MKIIKYTFPLILVFIGFIIYSNILRAPFIFDDEIYILDNYQIRDISNFTDFSGTRYIGFLSFAINYYFGELNTFGYHLVNVVIHISNAILVYFLVSLTLQQLRVVGQGAGAAEQQFIIHDSQLTTHGSLIAFSVSLIFLVHPIQTQAVSYITQRFTSLATFFYLLAIVLYIKARGYGLEAMGKGSCNLYGCDRYAGIKPATTYYVLSLVSTILAMKTKEISFTLPFIIILYEWTFFNPPLAGAGLKPAPAESPLPLRERVGVRGIFSGKIRTRLLYLIPYFLALLIIPLNLLLISEEITEKLRTAQLLDIEKLSKYEYILTQFRVILTYIRLLLFPINQHFEYDFPLSNSIFEPAVFVSFIFLLMIFSFAVYIYFRSRITHHAHGLLISFGILWFFITLSVESSVIPIWHVIFEHRVYLPSAGFILSLVIFLFYLFNFLQVKIGKLLFKYLFTIIGILTFAFAGLTYQRNLIWQDTLNLWLDEVSKSPNRASAHNGLGTTYLEKGMLKEAKEEFQMAIKIDPYYHEPYLNLGVVYKNEGLIDEAIKNYYTAMDYAIQYETRFQFPEAYNNLGSAYEIKGLDDEAIELYKKALSLNPNMPTTHNNLGIVYRNKGMIDEATEEYKIALKLDPNLPEAHYNLGAVYEAKGLIEMAKNEYETAIKLEPKLADAYNRLGETLLKAGYEIKANEAFLAAGRLGKNTAK